MPYEVILVDDGSGDETPAIAAKYASRVTVLRNERGGGAGAARNQGVGASSAPILAFTDADCCPDPSWLARGLNAMRDADVVQGAVDPDPSVRRTPFDRSLGVDRDRGFYQTANLFVRRELFDAVAGFRDWALEPKGWWRHSPGGPAGRASQKPVGEDTVFGWEVLRTGARSAFAPDARVHHAVFAGGLRDDMADRWHWSRDMPGLVSQVPELRDTTFYRHVFFNHWTAQFDLAAAAILIAAASRRPVWLSMTLPYVTRVAREARRYNRRDAVRFVLGSPVVEATTLAGLLFGSVIWRSLVL
jgi:hypothetical protein